MKELETMIQKGREAVKNGTIRYYKQKVRTGFKLLITPNGPDEIAPGFEEVTLEQFHSLLTTKGLRNKGDVKTFMELYQMI